MHFEFYGPDLSGSRILAKWVSQRIKGCARGWDNCAGMAIYNDGLAGAVVFHDYSPEAGTMCMSAAADRPWLNRSILYAMHSYIFNTAACQLAVMQVSENNKTMNRIARAYGYRDTVIPRLRGRAEAEIIWTLSDDDWRNSTFNRSEPDGKT